MEDDHETLIGGASSVELPPPAAASFRFWVLGLLNNSSYVIMIASAKSIESGGVGIVYLAGICPGLIVKATGPFWFDFVGYKLRLMVATILMALSFALVGFGRHSLVAQLFGVAACSAQSALGEASLLALSSRYVGSKAVAAWSSGTGFAGVFGYAWVVLLASFSPQLVALVVLPPAYGIAALGLLGGMSDDKTFFPKEVSMPFWERVRFGWRLWPTTGSIFFVYFSEYAMQSGVWAAMGFPVSEKSARDTFYEYSNWLYQVGVLCSRSSGLLDVSLRQRTLWLFAFLQAGLLVFFASDAAFHFWYDSSIYPLCFVVGLLGGAVYVFGFRNLSRAVPENYSEIAMACGAFSADAGILLSNVIGLFLQSCLYETNRVSDGKALVSLGFCSRR